MSGRESTEQGKSGRRGSEASRQSGAGKQPRQGADRVEIRREDEPTHHFEEGHAPSEQGQRDKPTAQRAARDQQGFSGAGTGRKGSEGERSQEVADTGSPKEEHTRHGRQRLPGNRPRDT